MVLVAAQWLYESLQDNHSLGVGLSGQLSGQINNAEQYCAGCLEGNGAAD